MWAACRSTRAQSATNDASKGGPAVSVQLAATERLSWQAARCHGRLTESSQQVPRLQVNTAASTSIAAIGSRGRPAGTFEIVRAGLHCSFRMSRQMLPWLLMLGWYTCAQRNRVATWRLR